jgi:hypothetical protein
MSRSSSFHFAEQQWSPGSEPSDAGGGKVRVMMAALSPSAMDFCKNEILAALENLLERTIPYQRLYSWLRDSKSLATGPSSLRFGFLDQMDQSRIQESSNVLKDRQQRGQACGRDCAC